MNSPPPPTRPTLHHHRLPPPTQTPVEIAELAHLDIASEANRLHSIGNPGRLRPQGRALFSNNIADSFARQGRRFDLDLLSKFVW